MLDHDDAPEQRELNTIRILARALRWAGLAAGGLIAVAALVRVPQIGAEGSAPAADLFGIIAWVVGGIALAVLFLAMAEGLQRLDELPGRFEPRRSSGSFWPEIGSADSSFARPGIDSLQAETLIELIRELRDISLLSDQERAKRLEAQSRSLAADLEREVPALLREHKWREARRRVQEARTRYPNAPQFEALEQQIEAARSAVENRDIEHAERQISDLFALEAWDRAAEVVRELLERHPDSARANALATSVRIRYEKSQAEQRARLMAQAQEATRERDWNVALRAAMTLIDRYPKSVEAESLRLQIPVLQANAEIQTRQRIEARIRELVKERRYDEAVRMAHEVITRYPNSPQAEALRAQIPKLEERAAAMSRSV